jgi:hypothetical protein
MMIELWQQMADLTMQKCKQKCRILGIAKWLLNILKKKELLW